MESSPEAHAQGMANGVFVLVQVQVVLQFVGFESVVMAEPFHQFPVTLVVIARLQGAIQLGAITGRQDGRLGNAVQMTQGLHGSRQILRRECQFLPQFHRGRLVIKA